MFMYLKTKIVAIAEHVIMQSADQHVIVMLAVLDLARFNLSSVLGVKYIA